MLAAAATGANAAVTVPAPTDPTRRAVIDTVHWSYGAAPTGGRLTIASAGQTTYDLDITAAGPGSVVFRRGLSGQPEASLVVTLYSGGGAVVGKLNVPNDWQE